MTITCTAARVVPPTAGRRLRATLTEGVVGLLGLLAALPVAAAPERPLWELGVGLAGLRLPHYRGAERSRNWLLPIPYAVYRGEILKADRDGLRLLLIDREKLHFDLSANATPPSDSEDEPIRQGMRKLDGTVEFGPNLNWRLDQGPGWRLEARLPLRAAFTISSHPRHIGWTAMPNLNLDRMIGPWQFGAQLGWMWGSRDFNGYYYDVGAADATAWRPDFRAGAGAAGWQGTLSASRRDGSRWIGAFLRADSLAGSRLRESPLTRRTSSVSFGVGMSWVLWQSGRLVPDRDELR